MVYRNFRDHLVELEKRGLLQKITRAVDKNTEIHPLVRIQFNALPEDKRKAFLFENVTDAKGRKFENKVLVAGIATNTEIYCMSLQCEPDKINEHWAHAKANPIDPITVESAPVQEVVEYCDENTPAGEGLDRFPIPISTPGFDPAPYITCSNWISVNPNTGAKNVGNYRGHMKSPSRVGVAFLGAGQDLYVHWDAARKNGTSLDVAIVVGAPPALICAAASKVPANTNEVAVAGGMMGAPIPMVKCKTNDLMVPADAEFVIEGKLNTEFIEPEGPFGEFMGFMHPREMGSFMDVKCITHRKDAIWVSLFSQVAPSESSVMRKGSTEAFFLEHLRDNLGIRSVKRVVCWEPMLGLRKLAIIQMEKPMGDQVARALTGAASYMTMGTKIIIAVDTDIDPDNLTSVMWAVGLRCKPHRDIQILKGFTQGQLPPYDMDENGFVVREPGKRPEDSQLLIDATMKANFPPISLPKKEYMENALKIWNELDLPEVTLQSPWYGYELGSWNEKLTVLADKAAKGDYLEADAEIKAMRKKLEGPLLH